MKLRNKKTGKVIELFNNTDGVFPNTLAELEREWEDAPEKPKEYWYIDYDGGILYGESDNSTAEKMMISMGNYFDTLEEAEKAVEKLKAWKRLKDVEFKLKGWYMPKNTLNIEIDGGFPKDVSLCSVMDDLDIVFGGGE